MKIIARASVNTEMYKTNKDVLKTELVRSLCSEIIKHDVFIEREMHTREGNTVVEMHFFALSYGDIDRLKNLSQDYPEINKIL